MGREAQECTHVLAAHADDDDDVAAPSAAAYQSNSNASLRTYLLTDCKTDPALSLSLNDVPFILSL